MRKLRFQRGVFMAKEKDKTAMYILTIVGIVAFVGVCSAIIQNSGSNSDVSGAAVVGGQTTSTTGKTYTQWTTCLDSGNMVKLGNHAGDTLAKGDVCTGKYDKMISSASCVQDADGSYSYKYSTAASCASGKSCKKDSSGYAYCG